MMDKAEIRRLVFEVLRRESQTHLNSVEYQVRELAKEYQRHDALKLQEIIWELLVQGVLAPGKNSLNLNLPFFHVTEYGEECLETDTLLLHDPDGYVRYLEETVAAPLDEIVLTYAHAAQKGFLSGNYLATMSLLADAGSMCIDMVVDLLGKAQGKHPAKEERPTRAEVERIRSYLPSLDLSDELREEADLHLRGLENLIAHTRNEHDRPRAVCITHRTAQSALLVFPQYVRTTYLLISKIKDRSRA
jgi:hypothetical protein